MLQKIRHISGGDADVADKCHVTNLFVLKHALSHKNAQFVLGTSTVGIAGLFDDGVGPNKYKLDDAGNIMTQLYNDAKAKLVKHRQELRMLAGVDTSSIVIEDRNKKRKLEELAKARKAKALTNTPFVRTYSLGGNKPATAAAIADGASSWCSLFMGCMG